MKLPLWALDLAARPYVAAPLALAARVPRWAWIALGTLLLALALFFYHKHLVNDFGAERYERGRTDFAAEMEAASKKQVVKRDEISADVATDTKAKADKAVAKTEESTHARETKIISVPVTGACVVPVGLPNLAPAVAAANAADDRL